MATLAAPMGDRLSSGRADLAWWPGVGCRAGGTALLGFLAADWFVPPRGRVKLERPQPAPRQGAARTNEVDAGKRWPMIGGEEPARWRVAGCRGPVAGSPVVCWPAEWSRMHPSGARSGGVRHDRDIRGPGCSVSIPSAAWPAHAANRARPGLVTPAVHGRLPAGTEAAAGWPSACRSAAVSRCQARVSSLRAIAVVAIFLPRRFAMAW